jgi:hypothetical protein
MRRSQRLWLAILVAAAALPAAGCFTRFNTNVRLEGTLAAENAKVPPILVYLVGVSQADYKTWEAVPVDEVFRPDSKILQSVLYHTMHFGDHEPKMQTLSRDDEIWKKWCDQRKVEWLFVFAHLPPSPGMADSKAGTADPRRRIFRLNSECWPEYSLGNHTLDFYLSEGMIRFVGRYIEKK